MTQDTLPVVTGDAVRDALRARREIALIDVRDEHSFAQAHPLFAAQFTLARLKANAP